MGPLVISVIFIVVLLTLFTASVIRDGNENDRQKRRIMHQCVRCGYDLRATPYRCPECGTTTATEALPPVHGSV